MALKSVSTTYNNGDNHISEHLRVFVRQNMQGIILVINVAGSYYLYLDFTTSCKENIWIFH